MKWKIKGKHIIISVISIFLLSVIIVSNIQRYKKERDMLGGLTIPKSAVYINEKDTHGGMGNDGEYFAKIQITENDKEKFLEKSKKIGTWTEMPIGKELNNLGHTDSKNNDKKYIGTYEGDLKIPDNIEGIYFFKDRFAEYNPEIAKKEASEHGGNYRSGNYTVSILDKVNNILYIYKYDS